ncbi:SpoIIE family protein phosphatase [Cytobacillus sp. FJAT-54145]|uniref:SpoIIE family protein phosphatase n=1 Tax=Cytobacillus spartinae TaxID=3299023 RepID=A0ABW6KBK3_9BACI
MNIQNLSLNFKLGIIFTISISLNFIGFAVMLDFINDHKRDGHLINLANSQLSLSQQFVYETILIAEGQESIKEKLTTTANRFEENQNKLIDDISNTKDRQLQTQTVIVMNQWQGFRGQVDILLSGSGHQTLSPVAYIQGYHTSLLPEINRVISLLEENSEKKVEMIYSHQILIMLVNLSTFLFGLWASKNHIVAPLTEVIEKMNMVSKGNVHVKKIEVERQDEVGQLSNSFNVMISTLKHLVTTGKMQKDFLPSDISNELYEVKTIYRPSEYVSGDFYNYIWMKEENRLYGYLIDVMGHGLGTALQASKLHVLFQQATSKRNLSLAEKVKWVNEQSVDIFSDDTFGTGMCFEFDFNQKKLTYCSCGINYLMAKTTTYDGLIKTKGALLGILKTMDFHQETIEFTSGDHFYFLTDGLLDTLDVNLIDFNLGFESVFTILQKEAESETVKDDASAICLKVL